MGYGAWFRRYLQGHVTSGVVLAGACHIAEREKERERDGERGRGSKRTKKRARAREREGEKEREGGRGGEGGDGGGERVPNSSSAVDEGLLELRSHHSAVGVSN